VSVAARLTRHSGFAHQVFDAQASFRAIMSAMANPGRLEPLAIVPDAPKRLSPALAAAALTLIDQDTPVFLDRAFAAEREIAAAMSFLTGCRFTQRPEDAAFALIGDPEEMPDLAAFAQGTLEYPDRSTTLLLDLERLDDEGPLRLSGPGILGTRSLAAARLPANLSEQLRANRERFPRGVDLLLCCGERFAGLPRSTRVEG
jgi:alpha-D-ribose 1-methylphosphonate 5-triphosphate synthase subunit PhnH